MSPRSGSSPPSPLNSPSPGPGDRDDDNAEHLAEARALLACPRGPDDRARAHLILGVLAERRADWDEAVACYGRCLAEEPADPGLRYFGHNNLGFSLNQLGRHDEAEVHCLAAIEADDRRHNAHKNLGLAQAGQGRALDAAFSLLVAARLQPADRRAWHHLEHLLASHPDLIDRSSLLRAGIEDQRALLADTARRMH